MTEDEPEMCDGEGDIRPQEPRVSSPQEQQQSYFTDEYGSQRDELERRNRQRNTVYSSTEPREVRRDELPRGHCADERGRSDTQEHEAERERQHRFVSSASSCETERGVSAVQRPRFRRNRSGRR